MWADNIQPKGKKPKILRENSHVDKSPNLGNP